MAQRLKRFSTSFKVIVVAGVLLVAAYSIKLFTGTKQTIVAEPPIAENHPVKKHRKKYKLKSNLAIAKKQVLKKDTGKAVISNIVTVPKPESIKPVVVVTPLPVKQPTENTGGFLYTTYVHPNVTGIVKMRQEDRFSSNIIADIPANAKVQVLQKGQMYYRVAYNNSIGFIPKWSLQDK